MSQTAKPEYIQLDANEDVPSVRDRLSFIRGRRVVLIWPETGTALPRKLDLVLIQREARRRAIQLALVTHDEQVRVHAEELNISTFETIGASERARWKRGRTRAFLPRYHKPEDEPDPEELMPVASRVRAERPRFSRAVQVGIRMTVLGVVLGAVLGLVYIVVPSARVELVPAQQQLSVEITLTANPNALDVDVERGVIPATVLRAPVRTVQQIATTGVEQVEDTPSVGVVIFTNRTNSSLLIPVGTRVSTANGEVVFQTTVAETANGGGSIEVAIEALPEYSGVQGNLEAGRINTIQGDLSTQAEVVNLLPTIGGAEQSHAFVTQTDRERLMGTVRGQLQSLAYTAMETQLAGDQVIVIESVHIPEDGIRSDWVTFSHEVGDRSDVLTLDMRVVVEAIAIDDRLARQVVFARLSAQKPPELNLNPESFQYARGQVLEALPTGEINFSASGEALARAQLDPVVLAQLLAGRSLSGAGELLIRQVSLAPNRAPVIEIFPAWFGQMPLLPLRIEIVEVNS